MQKNIFCKIIKAQKTCSILNVFKDTWYCIKINTLIKNTLEYVRK